ncbi:hypothetical protein GIB67_002223 [Kingdonia uniflora]|uniref:Large ribosomal subunit protein uL15/eL18 domain-containing protein n=1 Tax=Kingdonia uniflora TaxID=39325 RepID=A0A7J7KWY6_9MAGN|nr:hypothetical protein GIB67_002223 [Kingdonia uniflora]
MLTFDQLYRFLVRRTESNFNAVILKRLFMSKTNKPPISLSRLIRFVKGKEGKIAVIVGAVTDDTRVYEVPALKVLCIEGGKARREKLVNLMGVKMVGYPYLMMSGEKENTRFSSEAQKNPREAVKHFSKAPGVPHSHTKPYVRSTSRKFEKARGRRNSRGFRN